MSKVDALRAMREARYAANRAKGPAPGPDPAAPVAKRVQTVQPAVPLPPSAGGGPVAAGGPDGHETAETAQADRICGHRNIGGRSCQRPAGPAEKNHRYK